MFFCCFVINCKYSANRSIFKFFPTDNNPVVMAFYIFNIYKNVKNEEKWILM